MKIQNSITGYLLVILSVGFLNCNSERSTQLYKPDEANTKIFGAIMVKDLECGTSHNLTLPVLFESEKSSVDTCVAQICSLDCTQWAISTDPNIPKSCQSILVQW